MVSLDQLVAETEGYHQLIHKQVQDISKNVGSSEEANQLKETAKNMLEALRQCILVIKDSQLNDRSNAAPFDAETTPSPPPETTPAVKVEGEDTKPRWKVQGKEEDDEPVIVTGGENTSNEIR